MIDDTLKTNYLCENKPNKVYNHHEDTKPFSEKFQNDKKVFKETLENLRNPILEQEALPVHIISKLLLDQKAAESVKCAKDIQNNQFKTSFLYNTTKRNSLGLHRQKLVWLSQLQSNK